MNACTLGCSKCVQTECSGTPTPCDQLKDAQCTKTTGCKLWSSTWPSESQVTIAKGRAVGLMAGRGWVALGAQDAITDPTCGGTAIISSTACSSISWSTTDSLCISGTIPMFPASPTISDFTNNWGVQLGLDATDPPGGTISRPFGGIAVSLSGSPTTGLRAVIHKKGDPSSTSYCYPYTPGVMPLAKFAQDCWAPTPSNFFVGNASDIDSVAIMLSSGTAAITINKLCITGITLSK